MCRDARVVEKFLVYLAVMIWMAPSVQGAFAESDSESAARGVLERLIGRRAGDFVLEEIPKEDGHDVFVIEASNGRVTVSGSSTVAMTRGAYEYLRKACGCLVTWDGDNLPLAKEMPDFPSTRVVCPNKYRHCISVVTFSYTMLWWDWARWEREIDWMALHGYNMPLALNGQEAVWWTVWKEYGFTDEELDEFFPGPAFLPWFRMGNLNGHAGPLPQGWMDAQRELQKRILERERELGMMPVEPAFAGFVPPAFAEHFPKANVIKGSGWYGFEPTFRLDPQDPLFLEIGRKFAEEYKKEFGADHFYLADTFMEMEPKFTSEETKLDELAVLGETIYRSITASDPEGVWLMSGWAFLGTFWGEKEVKALFSRVPKEKVIVLDLAGFGGAHWSKFDREFIFCVLHNYGQLTTLFGHLPSYVSFQRFYDDPKWKDMVGIGMTPEGIENNVVVFELLSDVMWDGDPIDLHQWIKDYAACRYGARLPSIEKAWEMVISSIYSNYGFPVPVYLRRPTLGMRTSFPEPRDMRQILDLFLADSPELAKSDLYKRDVVDLTKQYLDDSAFFSLQRVVTAWQKGDKEGLEKYTKGYIKLLKDIELLVGTRPEYRLSRWIGNARRIGRDSREAALYEWNARLLLTVWGSTELFDYSAREWSGLISSFYIPRFEQFFDLLRNSSPDRPLDPAWLKSLAEWELTWCRSTSLPKEKLSEDTVQIARALFRRYRAWPEEYGPYSPAMGIAVGKPVTISGGTNEHHEPERAVDGNSWDADSCWRAVPFPQWICIDLEKEESIDTVQVFTRWTKEVYKYTIEVSVDGETWTMVVDMSKNENPATSFGMAHKFKPTKARYVRLTALPSGTLPGIHLVEVRVFRSES